MRINVNCQRDCIAVLLVGPKLLHSEGSPKEHLHVVYVIHGRLSLLRNRPAGKQLARVCDAW